MWGLINHTPFEADVGAYRTHDDRAWWGLWLKASFDLRADKPPLFQHEQTPLSRGCTLGPDGHVVADNDIVPPRGRIDLLVSGHAQQPDPAKQSDPRQVSLSLGSWKKALDVYPPLRWGLLGRVRIDRAAAPRPVSLAGAEAYGGPDHDSNPLGRGAGPASDAPPAVVHVAGSVLPGKDRAAIPGTLGTVSPAWPVRSRLGGTYDADWHKRRAPLLPTDFDPGYWQSAPADQQLDRPLHDAPVLHASGFIDASAQTNSARYPLPVLNLQCDTKMRGGWQASTAQLQAIGVDMDAGRVWVLYHAAWPIVRAAADVEIAQTVVQLADTDTFRVAAADAFLFQRASAQRRVAS